MVHALILAGGIGSRIGSDIPKQYIEVDNKPIISYCINIFEKHNKIDKIWVAANPKWYEYIQKYNGNKFNGFTLDGETRQYSILNGLETIKHIASEEDIIIIHDSVRPFVSDKIITECVTFSDKYDGVMPVLPMKDTVYFSGDGKSITSLLKRENVFAGQSPESFRFWKYYNANKNMSCKDIIKINGSSEIAVLSGMKIKLIDGDENNFKITTPNDLVRFKELINESICAR